MKTVLALGSLTACMLLAGCGSDDSSNVTTLDNSQIRGAPTEKIDPPGSNVKLGSNNTPPAPSNPNKGSKDE
jgi:hypothetical protein